MDCIEQDRHRIVSLVLLDNEYHIAAYDRSLGYV